MTSSWFTAESVASTSQQLCTANKSSDVSIAALCFPVTYAPIALDAILASEKDLDKVIVESTAIRSSELISLADQLMRNLICPTSPSRYSLENIVYLFSTKVQPLILTFNQVTYDPQITKDLIDVPKLYVTTSVLATIVKNHESVSDIETYSQIAKIISKVPRKLSSFYTRAVEHFLGPITNLASKVTLENINFIMSKLKLSLSLPLLYKFISSPSVVGKITAIWQFLELHELIWISIPWQQVQKILALLYKSFTWLCTQTSMITSIIGEKFEWIKAKVFSRGEEEVQLPFSVDETYYKYDTVDDVDLYPEEINQYQAGEVESTDSPPIPHTLADEPSEKYEEPANFTRDCVIQECLRHAVVFCEGCLRSSCEYHQRMMTYCTCEGQPQEVVVYKSRTPQDIDSSTETESSCSSTPTTTTDTSSSSDSTPELHQVPFTPDNNQTPKTPWGIDPRAPTMLDVRQAMDKLEESINPEPKRNGTIQERYHQIKQWIRSFSFEDKCSSFLEFLKMVTTDVCEFIDSHPLVTGLIGVATSVCAILGCALPVFSNSFEVKGFVMKLTNGLRNCYYAQKGTEGIATSISSLTTVIREMLGISKDKNVRDFKERVGKIHDRAQKMYEMAIKNPGDFMNSQQQYATFKKDMDAISTIYMELSKQNDLHGLSSIAPIWQSLTKLNIELHQLYFKFIAAISERRVPVCIWLWGRSDIGKSTYLEYLADELNAKMKMQMQTFTVSKGPVYWNNYCQQDIIKIDDFSSWIGPEGITDALAVFNLVSNAAYNPNMAALQDKSTMATPKFLFIASNEPTVPLNSGIQDMEAFERRRHLFINVTWPEHERCKLGTYTCQHWIDAKKRNEKILTDFSHLKFKICHSVVTQPSNTFRRVYSKDKKFSRDVQESQLKPEEEILQGGFDVTSNQIVDMCIAKYNEHEKVFRASIARKTKAGAFLQSTVDSWEAPPTLILSGPPGTGKTHLLDLALQRRGEDFLEIKTMQQFEDFAKQDFISQSSIVKFCDMSSFEKSEYFHPWVAKVIERYDTTSTTNLWIACINELKFNEAIKDKSAENIPYFWRRVRKIDFKFKSYFGIPKGCYLPRWITYTAEDVAKGEKVNDMVSHEYQKEFFSIETTAELIKQYGFSLKTDVFRDSLPEYNDFNPNVTVMFNMTSLDFVQLVNTVNPLAVCAEIIGKCKFSSTEISFRDISSKLIKSVRKANCDPTRVLTLDGMLLEAWNLKLLSEFKDLNVLFSYTDIAYIIDGKSQQEPIVGKLVDPMTKLSNVVDSLDGSMRNIEMADFLDIDKSMIPPWFTLIGEALAQLLKVSGTALVCFSAIKEEMRKANALDAIEKTEKIAADYVQEGIANVPKEMHTKLYPTIISHVKEPRHSSIDTSNPYKRYKETDPTNQKPYNWRETDPTINKPYNYKETDPTKTTPHNWRTYKQEAPLYVTNYESQELQSDARQHVSSERIKQIAKDPGLPDVLNAVTPNCVTILNVHDKFLCYGVMVKGVTGTTVSHLQETGGIIDNKFIVRTVAGIKYQAEVTFVDKVIDRLDFKILDKTCPSFKDISHHFASREASQMVSTEAVLLTVKHDISPSMPTQVLRTYQIKGMKVTSFDEDPTKFYHINYIGHKAGSLIPGVHTYSGDCGSLLLVSNPNWNTGKIVGMHVGAGSVEAFARLIHKEHYTNNQHFKQSVVPTPYVNPILAEPVLDPQVPNKIAITKKKQHVPENTKLYRNISPVGPQYYEPSILSHKDPRNPGNDMLKQQAFRWLEKPTVLSVEEKQRFLIARDQLATYYADVLAREGVQLTTLTRMQAINKLSGCSKSEPVNVKTSPGWPYSEFAQKNGKRDFIVMESNGVQYLNKDHPNFKQLKRNMDAYTNELAGRGKAQCVFKVLLKDEPTKPGKATRTIAAAPLDFVIVYRQYLHSAQAHVAENWQHLPPKVGINAHSLDWNMLFMNLASVSLDAVDLDFSGWDFSPNPFLVSLLAGFWNVLYRKLDPNWKPQHDRMREILYGKIVNFLMLVGCTIWKAEKGIPSGYPGTTPDNCQINDIINLAVYIELMEKVNPRCANVWDWFTDVASGTYGDDRIMTISPHLKKHLDLQWYAQRLRDFGFNVTSADKSSVITYKHLDECQFLSRSFIHYHNFVIGPLDKKRLCKTTWWVHDSPSYPYDPSIVKLATKEENVKNAYMCVLQEACLHEREFFDECMDAAKSAMKHFGSDFLFPTYEQFICQMTGIPYHQQEIIPGFQYHDETEILDLSKISKVAEPKHAIKFTNRSSWSVGVGYTYVGGVHPQRPIPLRVEKLLAYFNQKYNRKWNSVLINQYPKGGGIPWHKDDEIGLDQSHGVGCITTEGDGVLHVQDHAGKVMSRCLGRGSFYILEEYNLKNLKHCRTEHFSPITTSFTFRKIDGTSQ